MPNWFCASTTGAAFISFMAPSNIKNSTGTALMMRPAQAVFFVAGFRLSMMIFLFSLAALATSIRFSAVTTDI